MTATAAATPSPITMTAAEWQAEGVKRFGPDQMLWRFVCPSCGHVASVQDWKNVGASERQVAFSCIGRHIEGSKDIFGKPGPCNYAGGGLIGLNPVHVTEGNVVHELFAFADV